jgi:hypothetical protein
MSDVAKQSEEAETVDDRSEVKSPNVSDRTEATMIGERIRMQEFRPTMEDTAKSGEAGILTPKYASKGWLKSLLGD